MGLIRRLIGNKFFKRTALTATALFMLTSCATMPSQVPKLEPKIYQKCTLKGKLKTGIAKINITPKISKDNKVPKAGDGPHFEDKLAEGVHDDVYTRALILDNGYKKIGILNADIVIITRQLKQAIEERVKKAKLDDLLIFAMHNHSGPGGYVDNWLAGVTCLGHYQPNIFKNLTDKMAEAIMEANKDLEPSKIGFGRNYAHNLSKSRRKIKTPIDPEVGIVKIEDLEENIKAYIVNFAAHPTIIGEGNKLISGEFPGYTARYLEKEEGVVAIFANGALGDLNISSNIPYKTEFEKAEKVGKELAHKVLEASKDIKTTEDVRLNSLVTVFDLPPTRLSKLGIFTFLVREYLPEDTSLQVVEINDALLVGTPCDLGGEVGLEIKEKSKYEHTFVISQANDYIGYVLPEKRYKEGGYEIIMHFHGPKVAGIFVKKILEMINYLKND